MHHETEEIRLIDMRNDISCNPFTNFKKTTLRAQVQKNVFNKAGKIIFRKTQFIKKMKLFNYKEGKSLIAFSELQQLSVRNYGTESKKITYITARSRKNFSMGLVKMQDFNTWRLMNYPVTLNPKELSLTQQNFNLSDSYTRGTT